MQNAIPFFRLPSLLGFTREGNHCLAERKCVLIMCLPSYMRHMQSNGLALAWAARLCTLIDFKCVCVVCCAQHQNVAPLHKNYSGKTHNITS